MAGCCKHGNKLVGSIEDREFLTQSKIHRLFKKALETELKDGNCADMCFKSSREETKTLMRINIYNCTDYTVFTTHPVIQ